MVFRVLIQCQPLHRRCGTTNAFFQWLTTRYRTVHRLCKPWFQGLFKALSRCLFNFHSHYLSTIGLVPLLRLVMNTHHTFELQSQATLLTENDRLEHVPLLTKSCKPYDNGAFTQYHRRFLTTWFSKHPFLVVGNRSASEPFKAS